MPAPFAWFDATSGNSNTAAGFYSVVAIPGGSQLALWKFG